MKIDRTRLFDKRVVQRNIRAGRVTKDEYHAWLGELSDVSDKIKARDEGGDDDGYEQTTTSTDAAPTDVTPPSAPSVPGVVAPSVPTQAAPVTQSPGGLAGAVPPMTQGSPSGSEPTS